MLRLRLVRLCPPDVKWRLKSEKFHDPAVVVSRCQNVQMFPNIGVFDGTFLPYVQMLCVVQTKAKPGSGEGE